MHSIDSGSRPEPSDPGPAPHHTLGACDVEPIDRPGAIQPHGWLLGVDGTNVVRFWSDNVPQGVAFQLARSEATIGHLFGPAGSEWISRLRQTEGGPARRVGRHAVEGERFDVVAHRSGPHWILEFEALQRTPATPDSLEDRVDAAAGSLEGATSVEEACDVLVAAVHAIAGHQRTLAYRFDGEGNGEVLAERVEPGQCGFLAHRFPASDIPAQARALYLTNRIRQIPDAHYRPVPVVADPSAPLVVEGLDLSRSVLRSVSPVHLRYMRNMGTRASMSVSIVVVGRLWGLVSCHDGRVRRMPFDVRRACERIVTLGGVVIDGIERAAHEARRATLGQHVIRVLGTLGAADETLSAITHCADDLLGVVDAEGAALVFGDRCWRVGACPPEAAIRHIAHQASSVEQPSWHCETLADAFPDLAIDPAVASGALAVPISPLRQHVLVWFRRELLQTVVWAGPPAGDPRDGPLTPRSSFDSWREVVASRSRPWESAEMDAALALRRGLVETVLRLAHVASDRAVALARVNRELEAFTYTISHDLRAPMRHIAGFVDLALEREGGRLADESLGYLGRARDAAQYAGRLVDALLEFSRMGRTGLRPARLDATQVAESIIEELDGEASDRRTLWRIGTLPPVHADPVLFRLALRNLLDNARKFSAVRAEPEIDVRGRRGDDHVVIEIRDNGVGFDDRYAGKLFGVFQRLHLQDEFEGTGIGLATVRRIVERHGGSVGAHGVQDAGAVFWMTFPAPTAGEHDEEAR
jgi:light-regulated signal transduction histidine kinase (bacteriophytochrome)